jgi:hypothetical protein
MFGLDANKLQFLLLALDLLRCKDDHKAVIDMMKVIHYILFLNDMICGASSTYRDDAPSRTPTWISYYRDEHRSSLPSGQVYLLKHHKSSSTLM